MIIGSLGAIAQNNIKRILGYSSIGHVGFALMGLAAVSPEGLSGFIIYLFLYSIMMLGIFAFILNMEKDGVLVTDIYMLAKYSETNPATSFAFSLIISVFLLTKSSISFSVSPSSAITPISLLTCTFSDPSG